LWYVYQVRKREKANMNDDDEDDEQTLILLLSSSNDTSKENQEINSFFLFFYVLIDSLNEYTDNFLFWKTDYESKWAEKIIWKSSKSKRKG